MRVEGLFLRSRAGRRIFWTLMLAAAVPIALFGWLVHGALRDHFDAQTHRQRVQSAKYAGLSLLDNLVVARTVLELVARSGSVDIETHLPNRRGRILAEVAVLDDSGAFLEGSEALWRRWQIGAHPDAGSSAGTQASLVTGVVSARETAPVWMVVQREDRPGRRWIGEIDSRFLFGDLVDENGAPRVCVVSAQGATLFCPGDASAGLAAPGRTDNRVAASWSLFLRSDFGVDDWVFVNVSPSAELALDSVALTHTTAWGALATLLIVVMLSLIQVRRTMVPVERLIDGTRRLSDRDYAARVQHDSRDEFGELARSFNHMASQIGDQVAAMQIQSAIDREILNGLDVARILQTVARRIDQMLPDGRSAIVELDRSARGLTRLHRGEGAFQILHVPDGSTLLAGAGAGRGLQPWHAVPETIRQALPGLPGAVQVMRVDVASELVALIVIVQSARADLDADVLREIDELGGRVAVTLASADRERRLVERATRDSLTGLANRSGLLDSLEQGLGNGVPQSLLFVDLDRFKEINDSMGHQIGDELLRVIAARLRDISPPQTLVARPGGDEFVLVLPGPRSAAQALADTIVQHLAEPVTLDGRVVGVAASVGMTHHPDDGQTVSDLLRRADMAMYSVKARGGHGSAWFDPTLDDRLAERTALLADLHGALERAEFVLHYQPRRHARSGSIRSAEALLRWRHPVHGLVSPARFVPLLEETGLIDAVGQWAIATACRQVASWRAQGLSLRTVAVNLSTRQLQAVDLADHVAASLRQAGLPASALELEVTESIFVGNSESAIARLHAIQRTGVTIALDDFGTGYSSLSYLQKLPIGILKVDRSFVVELGKQPSAMAVTRSIVALAQALGLQVVAEGVETSEQARLLVELGCDELQGYLVARPLPADEITAFVSKTDADIPA